MSDQPEVTEFAIMLPATRRAEIEASFERFEAWMTSAFPDFEFRVVDQSAALADDDETLVVPILGSVGDGFTDKPLARHPDPSLVASITQRVKAFDADRTD